MLQFATEGVSEEVGPGGTVTTDTEGDGATPSDPVETFVTTPNAGTVSIQESSITVSAEGFQFFAQQINIEAPEATPGNPLILVFRIDALSIPAGENENTIEMLKDGVLVAACTGDPNTAAPDPCVSNRALLADGDVEITVLTSTVSSWNFGLSIAVDSDGDGILDKDDACPDDPEDVDGFEDEDGCPDPDNDSDGILDVDDNCPDDANAGQENNDGDEQGDACDPDDDNDGVLDVDDNCPTEDSTGFDADNDGCIDTIQGLSDLIDTLVLEGVIDSTMQNSLHAKIDAALAKLDDDEVCPAIKQLDALKEQIEAQTGKFVSEDAAAELLQYITNVQTFLVCVRGG